MENNGGIVVSTRIRLARNISSIPFLQNMDEKAAEEVILNVHDALDSDEYELIELKNLSLIDKQILVEQHLISPDLLKSKWGALILNKDRTISIMLNEEDHMRMQCILPGLAVKEAYETIDKLDRKIEKTIKYAYDEQFGYLTACPTNVGTGMRASVMMHLPALTMQGRMTEIIRALSKFGLTVRGLYGEGSEALGNMYQLSNQVTLGISENEIIGTIDNSAIHLASMETDTAKSIYGKNKIELEDRLYRSFGIFKNAHKLDSKEMMSLLSDIWLAESLGLLSGISYKELYNLMIKAQPAAILKKAGGEINILERDYLRAKLVREAAKDLTYS